MSRHLLPAAALSTLVLAGAGAVLAWLPQEAPSARPVSATALTEGREALREWDAARSTCWAEADADCLRKLYAHASAAGEADVALLRRWSDRGLVIAEMRRQVLDVDVVESGERLQVLRVTDRLAGGTVRRGDRESDLPATVASTRLIVLERGPSGWVATDVRADP
ncbi:hypothetical protein GCM10027425_11000 [Alteromonas gracilis]